MKIINNLLFVIVLVFVLPISVFSECTCDKSESDGGNNKAEALEYKLIAIGSILAAGAIGVCLPMLGKIMPALSLEHTVFFIIKAFAAGVILATGMVHVLPDAFDSLTSPCLGENPWGKFPFAGFVAMLSAVGTLMVDSVATNYYQRTHSSRKKPGDEEKNGEHEHEAQPITVDDKEAQGHMHLHTHATHGHSHGSTSPSDEEFNSLSLIRHRVVSQVLELGILVHSVIIGMSVGASEDPKTIKPLIVALAFHQFFEGMGLGGCISQAKFKATAITLMASFFALTTPVGIAIGIGISNIYDENGTTALIVEGIFNSASAGILIYMALVDLLAADFTNPRMQNSSKLQFGANLSLLFGVGCMSLLAKWA
ncbi:hypothetical protein ACH5RR_015977 [Cinchona calisaya]|uniref:Uncharacterized protein n=1 Tax=Cinchona calisaya TaxID=153742 RepID=A0ABD3A041_9GENT